jgi:phage tail tape-measure protein
MSDLQTKKIIDIIQNTERRTRNYSGTISRFAQRNQLSISETTKRAILTGERLNNLGLRYSNILLRPEMTKLPLLRRRCPL